MSQNLEARVTAQLDKASDMISRLDLGTNPSVLENVKAVTGADVATYRLDGTILATTLGSTHGELLKRTLASGPAPSKTETGLTLGELEVSGSRFKVGYRTSAARPDTVIAVVADMSDVAKTQQTITNTLLAIATSIVVLMSLVSQFIARSMTAPIRSLVAFTRSIASGDRRQYAKIYAKDEIGDLGSAFDEMAAQLRTSEEKLLRSEKLALTGLLAARTAHEIRNPLSAIKMQAQLLRGKLKAPAGDQDLANSILREIERVEWVIRGMLDVAAPERLQTRKEDLEDILDEVIDLLEPQLRHRKIEIHRRYEGGIGPMTVDRNRLKIAFLNLIVNASEAMTNGGNLDLSIRKEPDKVVIEIQDDGSGIDPSIRGRLFDAFVTTKREGVGLGLVNVKTIVELHGGTVRLLPGSEKGTRAVIELPLQPTGANAPASAKIGPLHG